jgi:transposase-like protein
MKTKRSMNKRRVLTRYSAEDRKQLIQKYRASGQGKAAYCRTQQLNLGTFCGWLKRYASFADGFAEVTVDPPIPMPAGTLERIEVRFPGGICVMLPGHGSPDEVGRLVREVVGC